MQNKTLVAILAGCLVLVCLCGVVAVAGWFVLDLPSKFTQISQGLGTGPGTIATIVPPSGGIPQGLPTSPLGGATKATPLPTQPGAASSGNPFADFVNKTKSANKYRVEFVWTFGGTEQGKYQEVSFFNMSGEVDNGKSHLVSKGGLMSFMGGDQNATLEFIDADGKSYMKGVSLLGMTDPKQWYLADSSSTSGFKDFANPDEFRNYGGAKDSDFKKVRSESLDGQSCDVWVYDFKNAQNAAITGALAMSKDRNEFSAIDIGQSSVWLCGDGFVHKWSFEIRGHDAKDATQKGALLMNAHIWDFNNPTIVVNAPTGAKPMPGK